MSGRAALQASVLLAEYVHESVGFAERRRLIGYLVRYPRVVQEVSLRHELEAVRLDVTARKYRVDPVQRAGVRGARARLGRMVNDQEDPARFQALRDLIEYGLGVRLRRPVRSSCQYRS